MMMGIFTSGPSIKTITRHLRSYKTDSTGGSRAARISRLLYYPHLKQLALLMPSLIPILGSPTACERLPHHQPPAAFSSSYPMQLAVCF